MRPSPKFLRPFLLLFCLLAFAAPLSAGLSSVVVVTDTRIRPYSETLTGFIESFRGRAKVLDLATDDLRTIERELALGRYKAIVAIGAESLARASKARDLPVLTAMVLEPYRHAADHPALGGVSMHIPPRRTFEALKRLVPSVKSVGMVYNPEQSMDAVEEATREAASLDIALVGRKISRPGEAIGAFESMMGRVDAFFLVPDTVMVTSTCIDYLLVKSFARNLPVVGFAPKHSRSGFLMSVYFEARHIGVQLGNMANRMSSGERGGVLVMEAPRHVRVEVNQKTAIRLGVEPALASQDMEIFMP